MSDPDSTPVLNPLPDAPQPERATFTESVMPGEPETDRRIEIADGTAMRERVAVRQIGAGADAIVSVLITTALLDDAGAVVRDGAGEVILSSHEVTFSTEALGRLSQGGSVAQATIDAREIAAAKSALSLHGAVAAQSLFAGRAAIVRADAPNNETTTQGEA